MLIRPDEQAGSSILDSLVRHLHSRGWKINPAKLQGPTTLVKCLGALRSGVFWDILCKVKDKLLHLVSFTTRKKHSALGGLFQFWHHILYLGMREGPLQQIQAMMHAALLHGPYGLENSMVLDVSVVGKDDVWILWQSTAGEFQHRSLGFWSKVMPSAVKKVTSFEKYLLA